jgi:hypothetical protein
MVVNIIRIIEVFHSSLVDIIIQVALTMIVREPWCIGNVVFASRHLLVKIW